METQEKYCTKEELEDSDFTQRIERLGITEEQFLKIICLLLEVNTVVDYTGVIDVNNFTKELIDRINSL